MNTDLIDIKIRAVEGGVTAAAGFKAAGIHAGFRKNPERLDYALVVPDKPCPGAGVFTSNRFCAAPVQVSRVNLGGADMQHRLAGYWLRAPADPGCLDGCDRTDFADRHV